MRMQFTIPANQSTTEKITIERVDYCCDRIKNIGIRRRRRLCLNANAYYKDVLIIFR